MRNRTRSTKHFAGPPWVVAVDEGQDIRIPALCEMVDDMDLHSFLHDPVYRRHFSDVLQTFTDEEFDVFERVYTRRFTLN